MNVCDECGQRQDDPQYSYHESWCSQSPALKARSRLPAMADEEPLHPMSSEQRKAMIADIIENQPVVPLPSDEEDIQELIEQTLPDLDPAGVSALVSTLAAHGVRVD